MKLTPWLFGFALGTVVGCIVPNPDHCFHQQLDTHAWCAQRDSERPFCSPCALEHAGCVDQPPSREDCPEYDGPTGVGKQPNVGTSGS